MKIVILTGSYNLHGTSNTLVDEFIKGAKENSHEIVRFDTAHLQINPYKKLVSYMNYKDEGMILGKGCGTIGMMPKSFYKEAYELWKKIKQLKI